MASWIKRTWGWVRKGADAITAGLGFGSTPFGDAPFGDPE